MPPPLPVTVSIVARNEAANLPRCLASVQGWVTEIVLALNDTTDASAVIAEAHGARVLPAVWQGFRETKNWALRQGTQPWALCLDADEAVSPALREALHAFFTDGPATRYIGADFPRLSWFLNRWIRHGDWYPDHCLRLIKVGHGEWGGDPAHTFIVPTGPVTRLRADLLHFPFPDLRTHGWKILRQSDDFAQIQTARGRRWRLPESLFRPAWRFIRGYFIRGGFLDGYPGFYIAAATAHATLLRYSRLYEAAHRTDPPSHA